MNNILVLTAVGAAAGAGYLAGDEGSVTIPALVAAAGAALALLLAWATSPAEAAKTISLRPTRAMPASPPSKRVLLPGQMARIREQERILASVPEVAVRLADTGKNQIAVIKVLRNYLDLGLKEAKAFSDEAKKGASPLVVAEMAIEHAQQFARDIEAAGGLLEFEDPATRR
jgi:ribosomal protein L7/L12